MVTELEGSVESVPRRAGRAVRAARERAADLTRDAVDQAATYPVAAVVGGLAVGALLGLLLPASTRERGVLAPTGRRITGAAREAAQRSFERAKEEVEEIRSRAARKVGEAVAEAVGGGDRD